MLRRSGRNGAITGVALCALILCVCLAPAVSAEEGVAWDPAAFHVTWRGDPASAMTVEWSSAEEDGRGSSVQYRPAPWSGAAGPIAWRPAAGAHRAGDGGASRIHTAELTGLAPDSVYEFRFEEGGTVRRFRTMPSKPGRPIRFAVMGDMQGDMRLMGMLCRQVAARNPDFAVFGGDTDQRGCIETWAKTMVTPNGCVVPRVAVGEGRRVLDVGDVVSLVLLDTDGATDGAQTEWLKETLEQRAGRPHLFAAFQVPAWPARGDESAPAHKRLRDNWGPVFDRYGLDAVFQHGAGRYMRSQPIRQEALNPLGTLYFSGGGRGTDKPGGPDAPGARWYVARSGIACHAYVVTLEGAVRQFRAVDPAGLVFDAFRTAEGVPAPILTATGRPRPECGTLRPWVIPSAIALLLVVAALFLLPRRRGAPPEDRASGPGDRQSGRVWVPALAAFLLVAACHAWMLGGAPLSPAEGGAVLPGHLMAKGGDWLVPRLYNAPGFDRLPGHAWVVAAMETVSGAGNEWTWRLPSVLGAALLAAFVAVMSRRWFGPPAGWVGGLSCLLLTALWSQSRSADPGALNTLATVVAAGCLLEIGFGTGRYRLAWSLAAGVALAGMLLTGGGVGLPVVLGVLLGAGLASWRWRWLASPPCWLAVVTGVALAALWVLAVYARLGGQVDAGGVREAAGRLFNARNLRAAAALPPLLWLYSLPVSFVLLLVRPLCRRSSWEGGPEGAVLRARALFGAIGAAVVICVVACIGEPRHAYAVLPLWCPLAGAAGVLCSRQVLSTRLSAWLGRLACLFAIGVVAVQAVVTLNVLPESPVKPWLYGAVAASALCAVGCLAMLGVARRTAAGALCVVGVFAAFSVTLAERGAQERRRGSARRAAETVRNRVGSGTHVTTGAAIGLRPELFLYAGLPVTVLTRELRVPNKLPGDRWMVFSRDEWRAWSESMPGHFAEEESLHLNEGRAVLARYVEAGGQQVARAADSGGPGLPIPWLPGETLEFEARVWLGSEILGARVGGGRFRVSEQVAGGKRRLLLVTEAAGGGFGYNMEATIRSLVDAKTLLPFEQSYDQRGCEFAGKRLVFMEDKIAYWRMRKIRKDDHTPYDPNYFTPSDKPPGRLSVWEGYKEGDNLPGRNYKWRAHLDSDGTVYDILSAVYRARCHRFRIGGPGLTLRIAMDKDLYDLRIKAVGKKKFTLRSGDKRDALHLVLSPEPVNEHAREKDSKFKGLFGMEGTLDLWVDEHTRAPLQVRGVVPIIVKVHVDVNLTGGLPPAP